MDTNANGTSSNGLKYATVFDEKLLGVGCDVEIVVDMESGQTEASIAMRSLLRSTPGFRIPLESLAAVARAVRSAKTHAHLLASMADGANDHQLNYTAPGVSLIVVQPPKRKDKDKAFFTLSIGTYSREGGLDELSDKELSDAVLRVETLKAAVLAKVGKLAK